MICSTPAEVDQPIVAPKYYCTYFDHNYLPQGLAMYRSLRRVCPEAHLFVLALSSEAYANLRALQLPNITIISTADFEALDPALLAAKRNRSKVEYIFTCTPSLCRYVFKQFPEVDLLTYLDADLYFFSDVQPMFTDLGEASIGIIPHGYTSSRYLVYGRFNVGWISLRRDPQGLACVDWWRERCLEWCKDKVEPGRYADQKYLDQWPILFKGVHIYTHPGANLARWNVKSREVTRKHDRLLVDGQPLIFFHFASFRQLTPWLYQSNFATHWLMPSQIVRRNIYGQYIAELFSIAGPVLPGSSRRRRWKEIGVRDITRLGEQILRFGRSIILFDYIVITNAQRNAIKFSKAIGFPVGPNVLASARDRHASATWFIFADTPGFSGQKEATRLIYENISRERWNVRLIRMPAMDRTRRMLAGIMGYLGQTVQAMVAIGEAVLSPNLLVHVTLGQTRVALIRDALPLFLIMRLRKRKTAIISLNGSIFTGWRVDSREARWLRMIMKQAKKLTVLGKGQVESAVRLGIPREKICIVFNTCDTEGEDVEEIRRKQQGEAGAFRLLHLSSLIDSKGYPSYLEALEILSNMPGRRIEAVLCGDVTMSQYGVRFKSLLAAETWIREKIERINKGNRVRVEWRPGAVGESKWQLYREAHGFVFPSLYKVEAQPLVLLEAMAYGCAVVSSNVGEIGSLLSHTSAILLDNPDGREVADAINQLILQPERRLAMTLEAKHVFDERFSKRVYARNWDIVFGAVYEASA